MSKAKKQKTFKVIFPDGRWVVVTANTASEARSQAKKDFGLVRLPAGSRAKEYL